MQELGTFDDLLTQTWLCWSGEKYPDYETFARGTPDVYFPHG